ncbi:hypothetical protein BJ508DRAFT_419369 [Ascobolus immersus RN42]|uniref:Uncharacterized protein n=1 Tax=Ascobolus immersus RN42 TaxID=1160509 RepID=A0A3N4HGI4_ASCIM|nr:hypothetical protein BJ508DRAFT_419369 [Ascobolus immersus RN42]
MSHPTNNGPGSDLGANYPSGSSTDPTPSLDSDSACSANPSSPSNDAEQQAIQAGDSGPGSNTKFMRKGLKSSGSDTEDSDEDGAGLPGNLAAIQAAEANARYRPQPSVRHSVLRNEGFRSASEAEGNGATGAGGGVGGSSSDDSVNSEWARKVEADANNPDRQASRF